MSKIEQDTIPMTLTIEDIAVEQGVIENEYNWKLQRDGDGKTCKSKEVMWLEWNKNRTFNSKHDKPAIGRSLLMSPFNHAFTWQTTVITEILELANDFSYIKFKTENSTYELFKL